MNEFFTPHKFDHDDAQAACAVMYRAGRHEGVTTSEGTDAWAYWIMSSAAGSYAAGLTAPCTREQFDRAVRIAFRPPTTWRDLNVYDDEARLVGSLGAIVDRNLGMLEGATLAHGQIESWPGYYLAAEGEDPDHDTPRRAVDWTGFAP